MPFTPGWNRRDDLTPEQAATAYAEHGTYDRAAAMLGCSATRLGQLLEAAGVKPRPPGAPKGRPQVRRVATLVLLLALLLPAGEGRAHGDAGWIMANPATRLCCGPKDCEALAEGAVRWSLGGWIVAATGEVIPLGDSRVHRSIDHRFWRCSYLAGEKAGQTRCLFVPDAGT